MKFQRPLCQRVEQLHTFLCAGMQEVRTRIRIRKSGLSADHKPTELYGYKCTGPWPLCFQRFCSNTLPPKSPELKFFNELNFARLWDTSMAAGKCHKFMHKYCFHQFVAGVDKSEFIVTFL